MEYVFVGGRPSPILDYSFNALNISKNLLISMIDVLNSNNSSSKAFSFFKALKEMRTEYDKHYKYNVFLDSGGYSIIVGDVKANQTREFIERYVNRVKEGKDIYDYVFSLDIPIFLSEPEYNTKEQIYNFNKWSLAATYNGLASVDETIRKKLYFVWHFKIKEQYDIWNQLYDELKINDLVYNRAAGGMVGLRGITQIDFSPFIAPLYRGLLDYLNGNTSIPFRFHALGVYIQHDRFFLWFLEKLFNRYLNTDTVHITYDSVNYMRTAQLRSRELDIYHFDGNKVEIYAHINCPNEIYKDVYQNNYNNFMIEVDNIKNKTKMKDVNAFVPLNIYSNVQLDNFFEYIIDKYEIVDRFLSGKMTGVFEALGAAHPHIFSSKRLECIKENFKQTWPFHQWFIKDRKYESFHPLMYKFINDIKFPASLAETAKINAVDYKEHFKDFIQE